MLSLLYLCFSILIMYTESTASESRVFNGENLRPNVHRYLVELHMTPFIDGPWSCSGSVINQHWIISSAHCFHTPAMVVAMQNVEQIRRVVTHGIPSKVVTYPGYNFDGDDSAGNTEKDLALIKMDKTMVFDDWLQPISLSVQSIKIGQEVIVAGYGETEPGNSVPREGSTVVSPCNVGSGYKIICTNGLVHSGHGDSGGPLVSEGRLVGVTSSGCVEVVNEKCETIYANVAEHIIWILNVIGSP